MKNAALTITSLVSLVAFSFLLLSSFETYRTNAANYDELVASGLIEKGWVPHYIPKSAIDIHEQHNIDSNRVSMDFKYDPNAQDMAIEECTLLVENHKGVKYLCPPFERV